jgi:pSer/pThr/pTyr-binding forkhead associated (FHA) protein
LYSIIVVPPPTTEDERNRTQRRLAPGERLTFGRSAHDNDLPITHDGVSRRAGEITA